MPNKDVTFTAVWIADEYNIKYYLCGGSANNATTYNVETDTFTLNNPTRNGYSFLGWSGTNLTGIYNTAVTIAQGSSGARIYYAN